jgi:hypothetical protein
MEIQQPRASGHFGSRFLPIWPPVLLAVVFASCSRDGNRVILTPPFNDRTAIGEATARWENAGEERFFAGDRKLDEPQVRLRYRVDATNRLEDKLFVRLGDFRLVGKAGGEIARDGTRVECILGNGQTRGVLSGDVWVTAHAAGDIHGFGITHFAVPLSNRGRALYREWVLQGRKMDAAAVDAEIAAYAVAPDCPRR